MDFVLLEAGCWHIHVHSPVTTPRRGQISQLKNNGPFATDDVTTMAQPTPSASTMSETPPNVTILENGGAQIVGKNYTLTCTVIGGVTTEYTYQWLRDGIPLSVTTATLFFSPLRETDSGDYHCEGTRNSITMKSGNLTISVEGIWVCIAIMILSFP